MPLRVGAVLNARDTGVKDQKSLLLWSPQCPGEMREQIQHSVHQVLVCAVEGMECEGWRRRPW